MADASRVELGTGDEAATAMVSIESFATEFWIAFGIAFKIVPVSESRIPESSVARGGFGTAAATALGSSFPLFGEAAIGVFIS